MLKYILVAILLNAIAFTATAQYVFTPDKLLKCTPVENQQRTNTCWSFATASFLEAELLRTGKPAVNLSEMYIVRHIYLDKARNYLLRQGKANFSEGGLSHDVTHAASTYGLMPESAYPGLLPDETVRNHGELSVVLKSVLDGMLARKPLSQKWPEIVNAILDVYLGPVPEKFQAGGTTYDPAAYAQSLVLDMSEYVSITSFTHHPFYSKFVLEIPDNHANGSYYNVPLDDLMRVTENALSKGYSIAWDGDVGEPGFSSDHGMAVLIEKGQEAVLAGPGDELSVTQESRQDAFETYATTDDHLMHVTGAVKDQEGNRFYLVKNSWGEVGPYKGFLYMSEPYYRAKTIAIMVHRDAIPADIAARIPL